jgi:hypothetical protein
MNPIVTDKRISKMRSTPLKSALPKPSLLRWEIGIVLLIKMLLLTGLWFLIFRWQERPSVKPDIAAHFASSMLPTQVNPDFSSNITHESRHVR